MGTTTSIQKMKPTVRHRRLGKRAQPMRKNHSLASVLLLLLVPVSGVFTGRRDTGGFVQYAASEASHATNEAASQKETEAIACQRVVRLHRHELLDLVITRAPLAPPAMLHNSKLHG